MATLNRTVLLFLPLAFLLSAAEPPSDIDASLRARVQDFYQLHTDRKFRQAEQLVAADTRDYYYESRKPDIRAFKIKEIQYAPDFQSAKVMLLTQMQIMIPGAPPQVMDVPFASYWKIDEGKWSWYVDQSKLLDSPFGRVTSKAGSDTEDLSKLIARISSAGLMEGVQADTSKVQLDQERPVARIVTLKNTLPGPVSIQSLTESTALKVEIAKPNLEADESTTVTITPVSGISNPPPQLTLRVMPMGQLIQITLDYSPAK